MWEGSSSFPKEDVLLPSPGAQLAHFSMENFTPAAKQKGFCGPRNRRKLHWPCLAGGQAEQLAPSWPLCLAACRHGHSRDHLSQRSPLGPIQNGMPRTTLTAPAISRLRTSATGHHSTEKEGTGVSLGPPLALTSSDSLSGVLLRPPQTYSVIQIPLP